MNMLKILTKSLDNLNSSVNNLEQQLSIPKQKSNHSHLKSLSKSKETLVAKLSAKSHRLRHKSKDFINNSTHHTNNTSTNYSRTTYNNNRNNSLDCVVDDTFINYQTNDNDDPLYISHQPISPASVKTHTLKLKTYKTNSITSTSNLDSDFPINWSTEINRNRSKSCHTETKSSKSYLNNFNNLGHYVAMKGSSPHNNNHSHRNSSNLGFVPLMKEEDTKLHNAEDFDSSFLRSTDNLTNINNKIKLHNSQPHLH